MYPLSAQHHVRGGPVVFVVMALLGASSSSAQVVDARRLEELKGAIETEIRYVEAESLDAVQPLLVQLDELRDEVGYLRVALRRGLTVEDWECRLIEGRLLGLREAVRRFDAQVHDRGLAEGALQIPIGTELRLVLPDHLDAPTTSKEVWFDATTLTAVAHGNRVMIPAGSVIRGSLRRLDRGSRTERRDGVVVVLREIAVDGRIYAADLQVIEALATDGAAIAVERAENASILTGDGVPGELASGAVLKVSFASSLDLTGARR
jgi:hypothetical protein